MARQRVYPSNADRQRAYRERLAAGRPAAPASRPPGRALSRPARLACLTAGVKLLAMEYECWLSALPEALQDSDQADRLAETVDQLGTAAELLDDIQPPKGYGRD